ncbi:MAG TPA: Sm ribonucleo-like protein [Blastocatellia bacterium]|nr:Sm ribonucleo-like protein [Blastocatellia bacterium]
MANFTKSRFGSRPGPPSKGKSFKKKKKSSKKNARRAPKAPPAPKVIDYEDTGMEAAYLKSLIDKETPVVVVLRTGEQLRGIVRYYDRDVFSLGPADGGPKLFLRKTGIRYLYEE